MEEKNIVEVKSVNEEDYVQIPVQSANTLFRFFKKREYLEFALINAGLAPRYCEEDVEYLNIPYKAISYPMICFCDINFHKLESHIKNYGNYGIAFSKEWGRAQGIQPIQYINPESSLCKDFSEAFNYSLQENNGHILQDYLLTHMNFIKPIESKMNVENQTVKRIFTDECEWRYIPNLNEFELPGVLVDEHISTQIFWNNLISSEKKLWLNFEYKDIKYIIVKTDNDFYYICNLFDNIIKDKQIKNHLISKIRVWNNERSDF